MKRKSIASLMILIVILSAFDGLIYANFQIPVEQVIVREVYYVRGEDPITGRSIIRPTMTVGWANPAQWGGNPEIETIHEPNYFIMTARNLTTGGSNSIRINGSQPQDVRLHESFNLATGSLYDVEVRPFHFHLNAEGTASVLAPESGVPTSAYAITDPDVSFISSEDEITVIWDDLGIEAFNYRIVYAIGDYSSRSRQDLINNKDGDIIGLRSNSDGVTRFYDAESNRNKLSYTIRENVYPGQIYSIIVEPTVDFYNSKPVMRNRNFPNIRTASTNVNLTLIEQGDYLRLEWNIPSSFKVGSAQDQYELVEATLLEIRDGQSSTVAIFNGSSGVLGYYTVPRPNREVSYQIRFVYRAVDGQARPPIEPVSNLAVYVPSDLLITPTRPYVPELFSQQTLDELRLNYSVDAIREILKNRYLVPGDSYTGSLNALLDANITFHLRPSQNAINFTWGAFERIDVNQSSNTYNQYIYDNNVFYTIWVTNSLDALNFAIPVIQDRRYDASFPNNHILEENQIVGYKQTINQYYNPETGVLEALDPNEIYYIKIVAKKQTANQTLTSEPNIVSLYYRYDGDAFTPPSIAKPPLKVEDGLTTATDVTVIWKESWFEVIDGNAQPEDLLSVWQHQLWVQEDGTITDYPVAGANYFPIYEGSHEAEGFKAYIETVDASKAILIREVNLGKDSFDQSDVRYYFHRIPYATVQTAIESGGPDYTFSQYYQALIAADQSGVSPIPWRSITPDRTTYGNQWLGHKELGLMPNTSYLFMIYPYRLLYDGSLLMAHYPTPIIVSTEPETVEVIPDPSVPNLYVVDQNDTSIRLMWLYNTDFKYELVYGTRENRGLAQAYPITLPESPLDSDYPVNGAYYEFEVSDLFPETDYYFWIRAIEPRNNKTSAWSNPAIGRTRDVEPPRLPNGFGLAALETLEDYGLELAVTDNYFTLEWLLLPEDEAIIREGQLGKVKKHYTYILEIADNERFIDPIYIESSGGTNDVVPSFVELLAKQVVKVNGLVPNRSYYVRLKTRLTVTGPLANQKIVKTSLGYTPVMRIITVGTNEEYDGIYDPSLDVLPEEDYEVTYDSSTATLTYRFREDQAGDNYVNQRLITKLIADNVYTYTIDLLGERQQTINTRKVIIPYSVMNAFNQYKVNLHIVAGDMSMALPYQTIQSELERQIQQFGVRPYVELIIETGKSDAAHLPSSGLSHLGVPYSVKVSIKSQRTNQALGFLDKPVAITLKTDSRYQVYQQAAKVYLKDNRSTWREVAGNFDHHNRQMVFQTGRLGTYGVFTVKDTISTGSSVHWSDGYKSRLSRHYSLTGQGYTPNQRVTENDVIHMVYGVVTKMPVVTLGQPVNQTILTPMVLSGIKPDGLQGRSTLNRETAITMFVTAHEVKYNQTINYSRSYRDRLIQQGMSREKSIQMAKAAAIGMIHEQNYLDLRPDDAVIFGELLKLWVVADGL